VTVLRKSRPSAVLSAAPKFTVWAVPMMGVALNLAKSAAVGIAAGFVPPATTVDQFAKLPQSLAVPPLLSHHKSTARDSVGMMDAAAINVVAMLPERMEGLRVFMGLGGFGQYEGGVGTDE
jgi:hypothetical protein